MVENNNVKMGFRDGFPIAIGYASISFAVGFFASSAGLSWLEAFAISVFNFTSAGQIAAIPIIASCGSLLELALTQIVINSRYARMSVSLSQRLGPSVRLRDRLAIAFFNSDELFAIACAKNSLIGSKYYLSLAIVPYCGWIFGTLFGAVLGGILPAIISESLSVAIYAMFIAIIIPVAKIQRSTALCILASIVCSFAFEFLPVLRDIPDGLVIVILAVALSALFALIAPVSEKDPWEEEECV